MKMTTEEKYMKAAIREAQKAWALGEVPIGCVIVYQDKIIGRGYNRRMVDKNVLAHAEITAMRKACRKMGDWRLEDCTMYVTLEPCPMCAGAIVNGRIDRVVYGVKDPAAGCCGSVLNLNAYPFSHAFAISGGVCAEECRTLLRKFFETKRQNKKESYDQ